MVPCCSCVAFVWCIFFAMVLIVPWIAAWSSGGFWVKERTYFEQPDCMFTGDMILAVMDDNGQSQLYSTNRDINAM